MAQNSSIWKGKGSKAGIHVTDYPASREIADYLLYRTGLEEGAVQETYVYDTEARSGIGLLYLKFGSLRFSAVHSKESISLAESGAILFDCRMPHRIVIDAAAEYAIVYFEGHGIPFYRKHLFAGPASFQDASHLGQLSDLSLLTAREEGNRILQNLVITRLLSQVALNAQPPHKKAPSYLSEIKAELETQYYRKHTLEELEQKYHVNRYRICREFKEYYQSSPLQYLHRMRIQTAQDLLLETDMKIHEISYEIGYESVNHFIHHFRKNIGITPAEYRSRL